MRTTTRKKKVHASAAAKKTAARKAKEAERTWPTINERRRAANKTEAEALIGFADSIDGWIGQLHAAVLHMQGEFVVPPSRASESIEDAINAIRWETAQMRRGAFDLDDGGAT